MFVAHRRLNDPAKDAARLLGWLGFLALMVGAPLTGVLSRRALFVLLPIGAGLLLAAASTVPGPGASRRALRGVPRHPIAGAAACLFAWAGLSLAWTPMPGVAFPLLLGDLATALLAASLIACLPERRPRAVLALLPIGLAMTALATLGMALFGPLSFRGGTEFDPSLLKRSVLTLSVLAWPALGALAILARWRSAAGLAVVVAAAVSVSGTPLAMAVFALAALVFAFALEAPKATARVTSIVLVALVLGGPLLPFVLAPLAAAISPVGHSTVAAMADWRALVAADGVRLLTGHGLDTARQGLLAGTLPSHTPRTILFEVWYELGLLGALALASVFALAFRAAGRAGSRIAPAILAGMSAVATVTVLGMATEQGWFAALVGLQAVASGLLCGPGRAGVRPSLQEVRG